jgi:hypothetical protein
LRGFFFFVSCGPQLAPQSILLSFLALIGTSTSPVLCKDLDRFLSECRSIVAQAGGPAHWVRDGHFAEGKPCDTPDAIQEAAKESSTDP